MLIYKNKLKNLQKAKIKVQNGPRYHDGEMKEAHERLLQSEVTSTAGDVTGGEGEAEIQEEPEATFDLLQQDSMGARLMQQTQQNTNQINALKDSTRKRRTLRNEKERAKMLHRSVCIEPFLKGGLDFVNSFRQLNEASKKIENSPKPKHKANILTN